MRWELLCNLANVPRVPSSLCSTAVASLLFPNPSCCICPHSCFWHAVKACISTQEREGRQQNAEVFFFLEHGRVWTEFTTFFQFHFLTDRLAVHSWVWESAVATSRETFLSEAGECILRGDAERTWSAEVAVSSEPAPHLLRLIPQRHVGEEDHPPASHVCLSPLPCQECSCLSGRRKVGCLWDNPNISFHYILFKLCRKIFTHSSCKSGLLRLQVYISFHLRDTSRLPRHRHSLAAELGFIGTFGLQKHQELKADLFSSFCSKKLSW